MCCISLNAMFFGNISLSCGMLDAPLYIFFLSHVFIFDFFPLYWFLLGKICFITCSRIIISCWLCIIFSVWHSFSFSTFLFIPFFLFHFAISTFYLPFCIILLVASTLYFLFCIFSPHYFYFFFFSFCSFPFFSSHWELHSSLMCILSSVFLFVCGSLSKHSIILDHEGGSYLSYSKTLGRLFLFQTSTLTQTDTGPVGPVTPSIYWSCKMFTGLL